LAAWAAFSKPSASSPLTSPRTVRAIFVIAGAPSFFPKVTSAVTSSDSTVPPARPISPERAMEKQDEWAAAMSSSGLVMPPASSALRLGQDTS
jgi:hypothetical protein